MNADYLSALRALSDGGVRFIVVGGVAAVLNGAPVMTFDLDIVPDREIDNVTRLAHVLEAMDAVYRLQRHLRPSASHLISPGHHNLMTSCGPLDVLRTIGAGLSYADLLPHTVEMELGNQLRALVLSLERIVALKEELGTEKDRAVLPVLRRTLEQKRR